MLCNFGSIFLLPTSKQFLTGKKICDVSPADVINLQVCFEVGPHVMYILYGRYMLSK